MQIFKNDNHEAEAVLAAILFFWSTLYFTVYVLYIANTPFQKYAFLLHIALALAYIIDSLPQNRPAPKESMFIGYMFFGLPLALTVITIERWKKWRKSKGLSNRKVIGDEEEEKT